MLTERRASGALDANRSVWAELAGPYVPSAELQGEARVDVAVVGGGVNGLTTAYSLRQGPGAANVAVLEQAEVGGGTSGRNAGMVMTHVGADTGLIARFHGRERALELHTWGVRAVARARALIEQHGMDSDAVPFGGHIHVAMDERWLGELVALQQLYEELGIGHDYEWLDADALTAQFSSPLLTGVGGLKERDVLHVNPCKHTRELKRIAVEAGAAVYEGTPVIRFARSGAQHVLETPQGRVVADKVVLAVNAHAHLLPGRPVPTSDQTPLIVHAIATEPLTPAQWAEIGWAGRSGVANNMMIFHWMRPTPDGRIVFGARYKPAARFENCDHARTFAKTERDLRTYFPSLRDVPVTHRWGGALSVTFDLVPHIGFVDEQRTILSVTGCWGHGVGPAHLNGELLSDLARERETELTELSLVNRRPRRWPPGPLRAVGQGTVDRAMRTVDEWNLNRAARNPGQPPARSRALAALRRGTWL